MKKALWTAVLSLAACLSLGCGLGACAKTKDPAEHSHTYDAWDYDETQHWKYCDDHGADKSNIDQTTRAPHDFSSGDCVCGAKKPVEQHTHEYTKWQYDEIWHWQVCPDDDTPDPAGKSVHEFVNGECECGAKEPVSNLAFELDEATNTYTVVGLGEETATEIVVPAFYQGKLVTKIGVKAFYVNNGTDATITSVTLPESVTEVGDNAFTHCTTLKEINLEHVEIVGQSAFWDVGLTSADLSSATSIKEYSFYGNGELSNVILGEALKTIADNAFTHCTALKEINLEHVEIVGQSAFWDVGIVKADLSSATSIMANAFYADGELGEVILGDALQTIGESAFCKTSIKHITVPGSVKEMGETVFWECQQLTSITLANGLETLGKNMCYDCTALESVTIPASVTEVGVQAFYGCTALERVSFGGPATLGKGAFNKCSTLSRVDVPSIADWCAFEFDDVGYSGSSPLHFGAKLYAGDNPVEGTLIIPEGVKKVGETAFNEYRYVQKLIIADSVEELGDFCFADMGLYSLTVGKNLKTVSVKFAFFDLEETVIELNNRSEIEINFGDVQISSEAEAGRLQQVDNFVFYINEKKDVVMLASYQGEKFTHLPESSPYGSTYAIHRNFITYSNGFDISSLDVLIIPDCVTQIGTEAFDVSIEIVVIGSGINEISEGAFGMKRAPIVEKVFYHGTEEKWKQINHTNAFSMYDVDPTMYYYSDNQKTGEFWHYDGNGKPVAWQ